jgi:pimeloyl-ACP methyl ester carboxylesterase
LILSQKRDNIAICFILDGQSMTDRVYPQPDRRLAYAEGPRVLAELAALMPAAPFLAQAPRGDSHPVLVMPGFGGGDRSTTVLRGFLGTLGHGARPWKLGTNMGPGSPELLAQLPARLDELFVETRRKVSLVGWSLGGVYARLLAHLHPDKVRQVITLGSPFAGSPRSTNAYRFVRGLSDVPLEQRPTYALRLLAGEPLPNIPSTAIFSKTDGIVPWQIASQRTSEIAENIEVYGSHIGLGFNPSVLYAVADRLASREGEWRPFQRRGWKVAVYGAADLTDESAGQGHARAEG